MSEWSDSATYFESIQRANGRVRVCALGGGPGTELLAVAKWAEKSHEKSLLRMPLDFHFVLVDKVSAWRESWNDIQDSLEKRLRSGYGSRDSSWPFRITRGHFCSLDFTEIDELEDWAGTFEQDLYLLSYVVSEVPERMQGLTEFMASVARQAPAGARFLFVERNQSRWKTAVKQIAAQAGLSLGTFTDTESAMDQDEDKAALGRIYTDLKRTWTPRVRWKAFYVVGTKT